jgi:hypothetical protein
MNFWYVLVADLVKHRHESMGLGVELAKYTL